MDKSKNLRVSIVIPVYNEADTLDACLQAIAQQTTSPYEVIVVDNNSTDDSSAITERYPFVRLLREKRQGVVYARNHGFNTARGEIIGRIDADSVIHSDWVAELQRLFADNDLDVVTGSVRYSQIVGAQLVDAVDLRIRRRLARLLGREVAVQGANMALRRSCWRAIRGSLCAQGGMHEDYDLAVHANRQHFSVAFIESLRATIHFRQTNANWRQFATYIWLSPKTYARHGLTSQRHMYPIITFLLICYPLLKLMQRSYDIKTDQFSFEALFDRPLASRVNPATFVD